MTNNTISLRGLFTAVAESDLAEEFKARAAEEIAKIDAENQKRKEKNAAKRAENEPINEAIIAAIQGSDEPLTASAIREALDNEYSVQKISSLCRALVADGRLVAGDLRVAKKGIQKAYAIA